MCDMCSSPGAAYRIEVEGSILNVCEKCVSYGRMIGRIKPETSEKQKKKQEKAKLREEEVKKAVKSTETVQLIVPNYASLIKNAREKTGLKQEEIAKKLAEKESILHKLESGAMKPNLDLARKLEKFFRIRLIEEVEVESGGEEEKASSSEGLTIGDLIHIKKR
ncbi:TIGR00270 family protein [Candidatus Woesearchaeota archaeon]|nr:TIGR00270 family protein [Candidatus Woesearchaeota archaeon]